MARRHKPVVVLLTVEDFATLEASAEAADQDTYLHAHLLLLQALARRSSDGDAAPAVPADDVA